MAVALRVYGRSPVRVCVDVISHALYRRESAWTVKAVGTFANAPGKAVRARAAVDTGHQGPATTVGVIVAVRSVFDWFVFKRDCTALKRKIPRSLILDTIAGALAILFHDCILLQRVRDFVNDGSNVVCSRHNPRQLATDIMVRPSGGGGAFASVAHHVVYLSFASLLIAIQRHHEGILMSAEAFKMLCNSRSDL